MGTGLHLSPSVKNNREDGQSWTELSPSPLKINSTTDEQMKTGLSPSEMHDDAFNHNKGHGTELSPLQRRLKLKGEGLNNTGG